MADFDSTRDLYQAARSQAAAAESEAIQTTEEVRRLRRKQAELRRKERETPDGGVSGELASVVAALRVAGERREQLRAAAAKARAAQLAALGEFAAFVDPRETIARFDDSKPIALLPLRLETRFRTLARDNVPEQFLCVRVFPDDILVDGFQPEISEAEYANVVLYWTQRWRAGGEVGALRAAWAGLVRRYGAGRAKWLIEQIEPANAAGEPQIQPGEHLLVIRPASPVPAAEQAAIADFWARVWSTAGSERDQAFAALTVALGAQRAGEVEAELAPANLLDPAVKPSPDLTPRVVFLDLPRAATLNLSIEDWTRGARTWLLPERLVLLGFRGGNQVLSQVGEPIPPDLAVGPNPAAADADQIRADGGDLEIPAELRWTVDFDEAVAKGMGFRVNLTAEQVAPQFDRLFVLGVRVGSDASASATELETLITHHQASRKGFSLLPQGRPTNNTDDSKSGYAWWEDPDESYRHFFEIDPTTEETDWRRRPDGAWLAGLLGIDPAVLRRSPNYHASDQAEVRAMNVALWPATLGYYMEQMMEPVFDEDAVRHTRAFFNRFVLGRGTLPAVRVGRQPYGVLPATAWSKLAWWNDKRYGRLASASGLPNGAFLDELSALIGRLVLLWQTLADGAAHVGAPGPDPQQTLLDIIGLHPTSAEFYQRLSQSFTQYHNLAGFSTEPVSGPLDARARRYIQAGLVALGELGWTQSAGDELPEILEKIFLNEPNLLKGDLVVPDPSETALLPVTRADGRNYIDWLQWAARDSHDTLRKQEGFTDAVPRALLYQMLRHALDLGFVDAGLNLRRVALQWSDAQYRAARREPKFIDVAQPALAVGESRWAPLYRAEPAVTGDLTRLLGDYIPTVLQAHSLYMNEQLNALDLLKGAPTARLERALVEHVDCLSYRLDAWRLASQAAQMSYMRQETSQGFGADGVYLGAFGWVENLEPEPRKLEPVRLDVELDAAFDAQADPPLMYDSSNQGHIHAPSLDHAVTAAILRSGHTANVTPQEPNLLAIDLSSERVRVAQQVIQGIRNGQPLGALLGYRLERLLHDEDGLFLDRLIYDLRGHFPLAGNRNQLTREDNLTSITTVEARNVVDGLAFAEHVEQTGQETYPYGLSDLPPLTDFTGPGLPSASQIGQVIDGHVRRMRSIGDAVGDLAVAEGVYQVVRGNYERAGSALDAFSKGTHPPEPEVTQTPRGGKTLTHRVSLHLPGGLLPGDPGNTTPRAKGEPALAAWLAGQLPDPAQIFARVTWSDPDGVSDGALTPSMADLGLAPVDLFYLVDAGGTRDMPGLDDRLIDFAEQNGAPAPRADATFALEYKPAGAAGLTLFEVAPLARALRGLVLAARPLRPTDLALQSEAGVAQDATLLVRPDKVQAVQADLQATVAAIDAFLAALQPTVDPDAADPVLARDQARDNIDQWGHTFAAVVRAVTRFNLKASSLTVAVEARRRRFGKLLAAIDGILARWQQKQADYDAVMADYAALPAVAVDADRQALLIRAGRIVSTAVIAPLPATIPALESQVAAMRTTLDTAFANLQGIRDNASEFGATLVALTGFAPTLAGIDLTPFDLAPIRDSVLAMATELHQGAGGLRADVQRRLDTATAKLNAAAALTGDKAQAALADAVHALLDDSFLLLPEFTLGAERLAEWQNAWNGRAALLSHLTAGPQATPFPIEDWLHGAARVREPLRHLETTTLLGEVLGAANEPTLVALQFPFRTDDAWLGLHFPDTLPNGDPFVVDEDKLLLTGHFAPGGEIVPAEPARTYSGLLLDEWIEVVPTRQATSGLAFHFDRPNTEPPQAILLATPPVFRGAWQWDDLVQALHETLDFARLRAVETEPIERTALAPLLPAVVSAITLFPITAMLNFAFNNNIQAVLLEQGDE